MLKMKRIEYLSYAQTVEGRSDIVAKIFADDESELPAIDGIDGYRLHMSSIAYVIKTGALYVLGSDGKWHIRTSADDSEHDYEKISNSEIDEIIQVKPDNTDEEIEAEEIDQNEIDNLF